MKLHKPLERCSRIPGYISVRGGMGLGDSLYLQSVCRYLVEKGHKVMACSKWPDVFRPLEENVLIAPFTRLGIDKLVHYSLRKPVKGTTQFQDCCIQAGISEEVDLRIDWTVTDSELVNVVQELAEGRQIVCVQLPRPPMDRKDGFGKELLPDCRVIQRLIDEQKDAFIVQIGAGTPLFRFHGIDLDLANKTTVAQLLDIASIADRFIGYVSFLVPLAESLKKPALIVWSSRGLKAPQAYIRQITPEKVIHGPWCKSIMDAEEAFHVL